MRWWRTGGVRELERTAEQSQPWWRTRRDWTFLSTVNHVLLFTFGITGAILWHWFWRLHGVIDYYILWEGETFTPANIWVGLLSQISPLSTHHPSPHAGPGLVEAQPVCRSCWRDFARWKIISIPHEFGCFLDCFVCGAGSFSHFFLFFLCWRL